MDASIEIVVTSYHQVNSSSFFFFFSSVAIGIWDVFVAKYSQSGVLQWIKQISSDQEDKLNALKADSAGNIYITGHTTGALGGSNTLKKQQIYVMKLRGSDGSQLWVRQIDKDSNSNLRD